MKMKNTSINRIIILLCVGLVVLVLLSKLRRNNFHEFMTTNGIEYTDGGCEYGWEMTKFFKPWSGPNGKARLMEEYNSNK